MKSSHHFQQWKARQANARKEREATLQLAYKEYGTNRIAVTGTYEYQELAKGGFFKVKGYANSKGAPLLVKRVCMTCGATNPAKGFAPAFNATPESRTEFIVLLCNDCYNQYPC